MMASENSLVKTTWDARPTADSGASGGGAWPHYADVHLKGVQSSQSRLLCLQPIANGALVLCSDVSPNKTFLSNRVVTSPTFFRSRSTEDGAGGWVLKCLGAPPCLVLCDIQESPQYLVQSSWQ